MRLIDADAEIKKIEEEIKRSYKAIDRWKSGGKEIEKWWDKKRVLRHVEQLRKIEEKYKE